VQWKKVIDQKELAEGWPMLAVAFALIFLAFGVPNFSIPWLYGPAMEEFGWSNSQVTLLSTSKFLIGAIAALGMGILVDKIGGKVSVLIGTVTGGMSLLLLLWATNLPVYYIAGALMGLSASSILAAMKVVVSRLFTINQGLAIGIVTSATSVGAIVMPLVWGNLLEAGYNWRHIAAGLSLASFLIATPLWIIFMAKTGHVQQVVNSKGTAGDGSPTLWQHFRKISESRGFWIIALCIFLTSAVDQALSHNYVLFLRNEAGIELRSIAWAGAFLGVLAVASKLGCGWFYDQTSITGIRIFYALMGVSFLLALPVVGIWTMILFITVRGFSHGALIVDVPVLTKHYLGPQYLGLTMGFMSVFINLGYAVGPVLMGYLVDTYGSFKPVFVAYAMVAFMAAILMLWVKPRFWIPPSQR
jgi:MFS family permease